MQPHQPMTAARRASSTTSILWAVVGALLLGLCFQLARPGTAFANPPELVEQVSTVSTSISSTTAVVAAVSGKRLCVKSMILRSSSAGVVVFQDGSGGTTLANIYLAQDSTLVIDEHVLGEGFKTTSGNGLYAVLSGATLTAVVRCAQE